MLNASSANIVGDTSTLILRRETHLAPSTRNTFPIYKKKKKKNEAKERKVPKGKSQFSTVPLTLE